MKESYFERQLSFSDAVSLIKENDDKWKQRFMWLLRHTFFNGLTSLVEFRDGMSFEEWADLLVKHIDSEK